MYILYVYQRGGRKGGRVRGRESKREGGRGRGVKVRARAGCWNMHLETNRHGAESLICFRSDRH